ncbi:hypothetical protein HG531_008735 [Fusarium graminearum]|nr:hypothetical protein HG531_008735 [Fusarium graminearum]
MDEPDGSSTELIDVEPRDDGAHKGDASSAEGNTVRRLGADASLLEEERSAVAEGTTVCDLRQESHAGDLGTSKVTASETVPVDIGSEVSSNGQRCHFGGVGGTSRGKDAPGDIAEELADEQNLNGWREEDDKDKGGQPEEAADEDDAVSPSRSRPSVEHGANDVGQSTETVEALLPIGRDLISVVLVEPDAEGDVVALHDDGRRDGFASSATLNCMKGKLTNGPKGSGLVRLETLPDAIAVLVGGGLKSFVGEGFVVQVDVLEMIETSISTLDVRVDLPGLL